MTKTAVLTCALGALLLACGAAPLPSAPPHDEPVDSAPAAAVWLDESSPLYAVQQVWGLPLATEIQLVEQPWDEFSAHYTQETGNAAGDSSGRSRGGWADLRNGTIYVRTELNAAQRGLVLLHELGHHLRGRGDHISVTECATDAYVMCAEHDAGHPREFPADADFDFVLGGPAASDL